MSKADDIRKAQEVVNQVGAECTLVFIEMLNKRMTQEGLGMELLMDRVGCFKIVAQVINTSTSTKPRYIPIERRIAFGPILTKEQYEKFIEESGWNVDMNMTPVANSNTEH